MTTTFLSWLLPLFGGVLIGVLIIWAWSQKQLANLKVEVAELKKEKEATDEKLRWAEQAETHLREAFESLASKALQTNNEEFLKHARSQVENMLGQMRGTLDTHKSDLTGLVHPLREQLTSLDGHVRELEQKREGAYQGLQTQLEQLGRTHQTLQNSTIRLTEALRNSGTRGRWGELQLRRLVEMAGMAAHVDFVEQFSGDGFRPDMVVKMPNGGCLPVDSKVPLTAYLAAIDTVDDQIRQTKMKDHAKATRSRVRELSQKKYWEQFTEAPDFVVMFVPIEACLSAAFELEPGLLEEAIAQQVLIATPVTLLALLKSVAYGWQQYQITANAREIVQQASELHKRLTNFTEHLEKLGDNLKKSVNSYNETVRVLEKQALPSLQRFQQLGLPADQLSLPEAVDAKISLPETP